MKPALRDNYAKHKKKRRKRDKIRADSNAEGSNSLPNGHKVLFLPLKVSYFLVKFHPFFSIYKALIDT